METNARKAPTGSLLVRVLLATSLAVTVVFAFAGWMVQRYASEVSQTAVENEVRISLRAYDALWSARVRNLATVSRLISSLPDVRAAFMTGDRATIRDTAEQIWSEISEEGADFLVLAPTGATIASLGGDPNFTLDHNWLAAAQLKFPSQASGYVRRNGQLFYVVFTPVYVQAGETPALINTLLGAYRIDSMTTQSLRNATDSSDFVFTGGGEVLASSLPVTEGQIGTTPQTGGARRMIVAGRDFLALTQELHDPAGNKSGSLLILRSLDGQHALLSDLRRNVAFFWGIAVLSSLGLMALLVRRILRPVRLLDRAAGEVARHNYAYRVPVQSNDELGRLATTFNAMCESIQEAREELVRRERFTTIARLSSSIVHDLRNPLAAIYGGAEMLIDTELTPDQRHRLASSIYQASRRIQELLQELSDVARAQRRPLETWRLCDIVSGACDIAAPTAASQNTEIRLHIPAALQVTGDRDRLERVFLNLIENSCQAVAQGGWIAIRCTEQSGEAVVTVEDSGPGIPQQAWTSLFEPFATFGKKNGLGLGLALSRQTLRDHSGDLWADRNSARGARFFLRLPLAPPA